MSLPIDIDRVYRVLLADGWHQVDRDDEDCSTFDVDAYQYVQGARVLFGSDDCEDAREDACTTGVTWREGGRRLACPLAAVLAVELAE